MGSLCFFPGSFLHYKSPLSGSRDFDGSFLHYKSRLSGSRDFDVYKPLCSSQSTSMAVTSAEPLVRRLANYEPSLWSFDHIQSLSSKYTVEDYAARAGTLKEAVKTMIRKTNKEGNPVESLNLVDDLQRLGISYHFEKEIRDVLETIYYNCFASCDKWNIMDLNLRSLGFRLLRQHGYQMSQGILYNFEDETKNLDPHSYENMISILNLYEASFHSFEDENILDDARDFATKYLQENVENIEGSISSLVRHALELPLHWRVSRVEAKWFINVYKRRRGTNPTISELAILDFNMVQAIHLEDLKYSSRWWKTTRWDTKLSFARDRLVENFLWTVGINYLPHFSHGRRTLTKVNALITTIDDVYDVYGTLDELQQFTDVTNRWDVNAIEKLPDNMKICFLGFYNTINEITYDTLTDTGFLILPYLKKAWSDLCKSYLIESQWYHSGHTPTLDEYLDNACVSISVPLILMHFSFLTSVSSTEEILQCMKGSDNIVRYSSLILRLVDDLATSSDEMARGDNPKSIQCYMNESGVNEANAKAYIKTLTMKAWKKLNKEQTRVNSQFTREFIDFATNFARMAQFMYSDGDGHGRPDVTKSHVLSLLFNPIQGVK